MHAAKALGLMGLFRGVHRLLPHNRQRSARQPSYHRSNGVKRRSAVTTRRIIGDSYRMGISNRFPQCSLLHYAKIG